MLSCSKKGFIAESDTAERRVDLMPVPPLVQEIESGMRKRYGETNLDGDLSFIASLQKFIFGLVNRPANEQETLHEAARFIFHSFGFKEITISLRSQTDGKYHYETFLGMTREAEKSYRSLAYDHDVVFDDNTYPGVKLSKFTELMLAELKPYDQGEETTFNRPMMNKAQRKSADEMIDFDYYAVYLYGPGEQIFGWLELSSTRDGKFPSMKTIRQLELFSMVLSLILGQWRWPPKKATGHT